MLAASIALLCLTATTAHADFRKALDALQAQDGNKILMEIKDALDHKNDDGIILFLGILKQYPKTWRPNLTEPQQNELFDYLEKATTQSSLQAQYRLAVISRLNDYPKPNSPEAIHEEQALIQRLEPIANKGYAPAAYHLYEHRSPKSKDDQENALKWLIKAAELGSTEAAFKLGMKYLNVVDDYYGCMSNEPSLCLPKDETKGWYWMQKAAMQANERNIRLGDFAYEMGNLYRRGIAGNKPNLEQAYLWYVFGIDKVSLISSTNFGSSEALNYKINLKLAEMQQMGGLKEINQQLDRLWANATERTHILALENQVKIPKLFGKKDKKIKDKPVFSKFEANGTEKLLDVYADGRVNFTHDHLPTDMENTETLRKIDPRKVKEFLNKMVGLGFYNAPLTNYEPFSDEVRLRSIYLLTIRNSKNQRSLFRYNPGTYYDAILDISLAGFLGLAEAYFPTAKINCSLSPSDFLQSKCFKFHDEIHKNSKQVNQNDHYF